MVATVAEVAAAPSSVRRTSRPREPTWSAAQATKPNSTDSALAPANANGSRCGLVRPTPTSGSSARTIAIETAHIATRRVRYRSFRRPSNTRLASAQQRRAAPAAASASGIGALGTAFGHSQRVAPTAVSAFRPTALDRSGIPFPTGPIPTSRSAWTSHHPHHRQPAAQPRQRQRQRRQQRQRPIRARTTHAVGGGTNTKNNGFSLGTCVKRGVIALHHQNRDSIMAMRNGIHVFQSRR